MQVQRPQPFPKYFASCIWLLAFCLSHLATFAQVFPIQVNTSITPPYSPYLADYTTPGSQRLVTQIRANDITLSDYAVKLRLTIEGVGITIRTKQTFTPQPITVEGGLPLILYGEDLIEYFGSDNLDFAGYSKKEFDKTGKLPEGVYRFIIEVLDYNRGTVVSNKGSAVAWIILNDPPLLNLPRKDAKIKIVDPTNIPFTWTPRHTGSPNSAFSTEYIFRMVEIWPANRNPYDAFLSQPTLYEVTTTQSQIIYGMAEPALIPGRKYAWQVQARDIDGKDLFKNQGKSEVYVFQFGYELGLPENLRKEASNASSISIRWEPSASGEMPDQYRIRYKSEGSDKWKETVTQQTWINLLELTANTNYDVQVRGEKETRSGEYTTSLRVNTLASNPDNGFNCGAPVNLIPPGNNPPLLSLSAGDVVSCGDFKAVVTEVTRSSNGTFTGKGLMQVKMFNGANVEVAFSGSINSVYQFTSGGFVSTYEQGSSISQMVDNAYKIGEEQEEADTNPTDSIGKEATYVVSVEIVSVVVSDEGKIVVTDEAGNETEYEIKKDEKTGEIKETIIQDKSGDQWVVKKDGVSGETTVTKLTEGSAATVQADPIKDRIIVLILEQFEEEIAAWLRINGKGGEEDEDVLVAEELASCFKKDAGQLKYINQKTIPYFKTHPDELRAKIETNQTHKDLFDRISILFNNSSSVDWNKLNEDDKELSRDAACKALTDEIAPLVDFYERVKPLVSNEDYKSALKKIKAIYEFFNACHNQGWESYNDEGIIPYCFWRDQNPSTSLYYTNADLPFTSGLIDGAYIESEGLDHLPNVVRDITEFPRKLLYAYTKAYFDCQASVMMKKIEELEYVVAQLQEVEEGGLWNWVSEQLHDYEGQSEELVQYFQDCRDAESLRETISDLYEIVSNWEEIKTLSEEVYSRLGDYWNSLGSTNNIGRYRQGRVIIPAATLIVPFGAGVASKAEKLKDGLKYLREASAENWRKFVGRIGESLSTRTGNADRLSAKLKAIYDDLVKTGYSAYDEGTEIIFRNADNTVVAKVSDDAFHIKIPHGNGWAKQTNDFEALKIFEEIKESRKVYRIGTLDVSETTGAQYWSPENPLSFSKIEDYADKYGLPIDRLKGENKFVIIGEISKTEQFITRPAVEYGGSKGGGIEVVTSSGAVKMESFHTLEIN